MARIYLDVTKEHFGGHVINVKESQQLTHALLDYAGARNGLAQLRSPSDEPVAVNPLFVVTVR